MFINPRDLVNNPGIIEDIEKASMRFVTHALVEFRENAQLIFAEESDLAGDIGEDITREALDRIGMSKIDVRLYGKIDYKKARYLFHPEYAVKQALFVDSKAEKGDPRSATIQTAQTSMRIMFHGGRGAIVAIDEQGTLSQIVEKEGVQFLTTTIFVKYNYEITNDNRNDLINIVTAAIPNGMLQTYYNPNAGDTIWRVGRHAPSREEAFRVRLAFHKLEDKRRWRIQRVPMIPHPFTWHE